MDEPDEVDALPLWEGAISLHNALQRLKVPGNWSWALQTCGGLEMLPGVGASDSPHSTPRVVVRVQNVEALRAEVRRIWAEQALERLANSK